MKLSKNKAIVLLASAVLLIVLGLVAYFIVIFNDRIKVQSEEIESLKSAVPIKEEVSKEQKEKVTADREDPDSRIKATSVYWDEDYRVYAFNNSINAIDLDFDTIPDVVLKSNIQGKDYYKDYEASKIEVYGFYIEKIDTSPVLSDYYNVVTKEIPDKKIGEFERDFVTRNLHYPVCAGGEAIRVVLNKKGDTILVKIKMENKNGIRNYANFELYKLKKSGGTPDSDYIFSYIKAIRSRYASCDLEKFANVDVVTAIKEAGF